LSGHLGYRDGLLKQYRRYALNFQGYAIKAKTQRPRPPDLYLLYNNTSDLMFKGVRPNWNEF
jgi:hypothetical protein